MRLGIHLPQYGRAAGPAAITEVAQRAEALGYADVWVSDHVVQPAAQGYPSPYLFEPLLTLGWAAAATNRIGLGTSVLVVPQYHPLPLANSLASLDRLSGGRVTVAAGVGWSAAEYQALGQDFSTRGARLDEALEIFRTVWSEDPVSFHGQHYQFDDLKIQPKPEGPMPVWIGGRAARALDRAVRLGDGYQGISTSPDEMAELVKQLRAERPEPEFVISYRTGWDPNGMDASEIADEVAAYREAGVDHVVAAPWRTSSADWIDSMERLVAIVQPELS